MKTTKEQRYKIGITVDSQPYSMVLNLLDDIDTLERKLKNARFNHESEVEQIKHLYKILETRLKDAEYLLERANEFIGNDLPGVMNWVEDYEALRGKNDRISNVDLP